MSPERLNKSRAEELRKRREEEQKRRDALTKKLGRKPKIESAPRRAPRSTPTVTPGRLRRRYDAAFATPYGRSGYNRPKAPSIAISLPEIQFGFGPRWISFLIAAACGAMMYVMWTSDPFIVRTANIMGNNRIDSGAIQSVLGVLNQPSALLNPAQIEYNVLYSFPDISSARAEITMPAGLAITVTERKPVVAWEQDGKIIWVDADGYAFPPRGSIDGLVTIQATGTPPAPLGDVSQTIGARHMLTAELASSIVTLAPSLPEGAALIYDPSYGLGWSDPRGWRVYFGDSEGDMPLKLKVYQSMVDYLSQHDITPTLISVAYPEAPFYRVEQ